VRKLLADKRRLERAAGQVAVVVGCRPDLSRVPGGRELVRGNLSARHKAILSAIFEGRRRTERRFDAKTGERPSPAARVGRNDYAAGYGGSAISFVIRQGPAVSSRSIRTCRRRSRSVAGEHPR